MEFSLYILECADGTLYTGIAVDVARRLAQHNGEKPKGARYTSARRPVKLVYEAKFPSRSDALKEEIRIKRLTRDQKQALIAAFIIGAAVS
ncbi:MAG: GIY-YIG nuclease family protein [Hyphomicrobium sp.]